MPCILKTVSGCIISLFKLKFIILDGSMRSYGSCDVRSQIVAIFGQKSDFGDFSTSKNNTWVRRSAEKFSAWTTNINYFLQKNFHGHTTLRKISLRSSRGEGRFPPGNLVLDLARVDVGWQNFLRLREKWSIGGVYKYLLELPREFIEKYRLLEVLPRSLRFLGRNPLPDSLQWLAPD